jgi:hypothetical protein
LITIQRGSRSFAEFTRTPTSPRFTCEAIAMRRQLAAGIRGMDQLADDVV